MQKTLGNQPFSRDNGGASNEAGHVGAETPDAALTTDAGEGIDMADSDSTPGKAPAFQFYPNDFLADANVIVMSMQERGVYITLICLCWQQGSLPASIDRLAALCGMPLTTFRRLWPAVEVCFRLHNSGDRYLHPRLERERRKHRAYRKLQSDKGKLGGRPKKPELSDEKAAAFPRVAPVESSSNFNLRSSSLDSSHTNTRARDVDEVAERAGRFCNEVYPALYAKFRKGARYVSRPALDFQEAVQLCRVWDDARLEKIATVFLTTDHEFAEKGSRTMAQFRALASWCDSRLAEAGIA